MAFKLTRQQASEWAEHQRRIREAFKQLTDSIHNFNASVKQGHGALQFFATQYNEATAQAQKFINGIGEEWQGVWEQQPKAWKDGHKGQQIADIIQSLNRYTPEEFDLESHVRIELPGINEAEEIESLKPED